MRESLRGYVLGIMYLADQEGQENLIIQEINSFIDLLASQPMLGDVISDSSIPPRKRQAILGDLLSSKVNPKVSRLLQAFVGTENPRIIIESIKDLAMVFNGEGKVALDGGFASSGRISGFAQAIFESLMDDSSLGGVEGQLYDFSRIVESNRILRRTLSGIGSDAVQRQGLVKFLLDGKCDKDTLEIVLFAAKIDRLRDFVEVLDALVAQAADIRNRKIANVQSAIELSSAQKEQIAQALSSAIGSEVEMRMSINPSLVGGVLAVVGDTVFDGSVRNRIEQLRVRLGLPATVKSRERS